MTKHKHTHTINSNKNTNKIHIVINEKKTKRRKRSNKKTHPKTHPTIIQNHIQQPVMPPLPPRQYDYAGFASSYNGGNPDARGQPIAIRHGNDLLNSVYPQSVSASQINPPSPTRMVQMHPPSPTRSMPQHDNQLLQSIHSPAPIPSPYKPHVSRSSISPPPDKARIFTRPYIAPAKTESDNPLLQSVNSGVTSARPFIMTIWEYYESIISHVSC